VSEVILQQTRVGQGLAYYDRFIERFPDVEKLAMAEEEDVMKIWKGLGYYSRARNMQESARIIVREHGAQFPVSYDELRKLKGIGDYTASAVASIAAGGNHPVVDGNVLRVVSRYLGSDIPVDSSAGKKRVKDFLRDTIDADDPGTFNQAVMELGALVCKPGQPDCHLCPLSQSCNAFQQGNAVNLPVTSKANALRPRYFHYLVIMDDNQNDVYTWIRKRTTKDIWRDLYDFPLVEADRQLPVDELICNEEFKSLFSHYDFEIDGDYISMRHVLSHQELNVRFFRFTSPAFDHEKYVKVPVREIHKYPVSRLIENYLKKVGW